METKQLFEAVMDGALIQWTISNPRKKTELYKKIMIRPVTIGGRILFQMESFTEKQAFHENFDQEALGEKLDELNTENDYKQYDIFTETFDFHVLINKKGQMNIKKNRATKKATTISHNQQKQYVLEEGKAIPFLVELGIMTASGKVIDKKYNKFKQINRFVEMVDDVMTDIEKRYEENQREVFRIIDFGSGKSYLTFALYHYLVNVKKMAVDIIGLDLKADVINDCNILKDQLGYEHLKFIVGSIEDYDEFNQVDMVVTLHACNTATDAALKKAVLWDASVIMSVPCCHKEFNKQIDKNAFMGLMEHGIIKERVSALFTDAIRGKWLTAMGYKVQLLEFVDMAHTPKNIMIRGIKTGEVDTDKVADIDELLKQLKLELTIMD